MFRGRLKWGVGKETVCYALGVSGFVKDTKSDSLILIPAACVAHRALSSNKEGVVQRSWATAVSHFVLHGQAKSVPEDLTDRIRSRVV